MPILDETRMSFEEACQALGRSGVTVRVWIRKGLRGVRLETFKIGKTVWTSREAIRRFIASTNAVQGAEQP